MTVEPTSLRTNIGLSLRNRARLSPDLEALVDVNAGRRFSYLEMAERANRVAAGLDRLGLRAGDRLAILAPNSHQYLELFYGAALAGIITVPLNSRLAIDELVFLLADSGSVALCSGGAHDTAVGELRARAAADLPAIAHWIRIGDDDAEDTASTGLRYDELLGDGPAAPVPPAAGGSDPLFIMYTSGTTGTPKGAVHTHDSFEWTHHNGRVSTDVRFKDRFLVNMPLFHVGALVPATSLIYCGGTVVLMRQFDAGRTWALMRDERVTGTMAVPAMLTALLEVLPGKHDRPASLRTFLTGTAPVPIPLLEAYQKLGFEVLQTYALTESGGNGCTIGPEDFANHVGSVGRSFFHTDLRVVDEAGEDVPPHQPGEILLAGRHVMAGYWNRPDATAEALRDGWLHTGDIGELDEEGFVYIRDRIKDMIISGGENVYPAEIENVLRGDPRVADAAVIGMPSARWGESVLAVVVARDGDLTEADVIEHCAPRLARFKQPRRVVFTDEIPRNSTGKVLKGELRRQFPLSAPE